MGVPVNQTEVEQSDGHGIPQSASPSCSHAHSTHQHQPQSKSQPSPSDGSPTDSLRSNHISIVSLNDDDDSSSVADSDSDFDDIHTKVPAFIAEAIRNGGSPSTLPAMSNGMIVINNGVSSFSDLIAGGVGNGRPNIGSIALQNSSDITFGDKTFYQGPVTVKQFFLEKDRWRTNSAGGEVGGSGCENGAFVANEVDESRETEDLPSAQNVDTKPGSWQKLIELEKRPLMLTIVLTAVLLLVGMLGTMLFLLLQNQDSFDDHTGDGDDGRPNIPVDSTIGYGLPLRLIVRQQWLAQPPNNQLKPLEMPATKVIIAHTATEQCVTQAECVFSVRLMQTYHMESMKWDDIAYNFLVGGDGAAYEGRGWDAEGAHTLGNNQRSICIAFIGTFIKVMPPDRQLQAALRLIEEGLRLGKLAPDYKLYGHRQLIATESPGQMLYQEIKDWPHWSNDLNP